MKPPLESSVPGWLFHALQNDPAFRVLTMDGLGWIEPYAGSVVPAPFGHDEVAKKYLIKHKPWTRLKIKPLEELLVLRWFHYLREHLEFIPTLRIFCGGAWLNPYRGEWVTTVPLEGDKVTLRTIEGMARLLARSNEAQTGKMIESWRIDRLVADGPPQAMRRREDRGVPAKAPVLAMPVSPPKLPTTPADPRITEPQTASIRPSGGGRSAATKLSRQTDFLHIKHMLIKMLARPPRIDGIQTIVHYEPHSAISRDLYDLIQPDPEHMLLAIGDITGQGPGAALMVASTLKALREIAKGDTDLISVVCKLSDKVRPDLLLDCQITLFAAILDIPRRTLTYLSAGHHAAILLNGARETPIQQLGGKGQPLGPGNPDTFRLSLRPVTMQLEAGDILLLYSDGLFKAVDLKQEEFGRFRLLASCLGNLGRPCSELVQRVLEDAKAHAGGRLNEDMTMLALRVKEPQKPGEDPSSFNESWLGRTQMS